MWFGRISCDSALMTWGKAHSAHYLLISKHAHAAMHVCFKIIVGKFHELVLFLYGANDNTFYLPLARNINVNLRSKTRAELTVLCYIFKKHMQQGAFVQLFNKQTLISSTYILVREGYVPFTPRLKL